ncbi:MAG: NTP transferase domain-containing protein [Candidatus Diapherotrites archaeon]|nr:NTP transferase domain-containing protein [Candidatus Diapherotrites archaeon]
MKIIILAAGSGIRLRESLPKCLIELKNGMTILDMQLRSLTRYLNKDDIIVVVGYKKELVMERFPDLMYVYNSKYAISSASQSLKLALNKVNNEDVLWINGDVIFQHRIIKKLLTFNKNCMVVNRVVSLGEEEVKYRLDKSGVISEVSKRISNGRGEVLGINFIKSESIDLIKKGLSACADSDFAVTAVDKAIKLGLKIYPLYIEEQACIEVDFLSDLELVNKLLLKNVKKF